MAMVLPVGEKSRQIARCSLSCRSTKTRQALIDERRPGSSARQVNLAGYLDDSRRFGKKSSVTDIGQRRTKTAKIRSAISTSYDSCGTNPLEPEGILNALANSPIWSPKAAKPGSTRSRGNRSPVIQVSGNANQESGFGRAILVSWLGASDLRMWARFASSSPKKSMYSSWLKNAFTELASVRT
jgi:hypothetical protein